MKTLTQILKQTAKKILAPALISTALLTGLQGSSCDSKPYIPTTTSSSTSTSTSTSQEPTHPASGYVYEMGSTKPLEGIIIDMNDGNHQATTDSNGHWQINNLPEGNYNIIFDDPSDTYIDYNAGIWESSSSTRLEQNVKLFPECHSEYFENTIRKDNSSPDDREGMITKWNLIDNWPKFRIYTLEYISSTGYQVDPIKITKVKDIIKSNLSQFCHTTFTEQDIEEMATKYVQGEFPGVIKIYWRTDDARGGANYSWFKPNNEVNAAYAHFGIEADSSVELQEITEIFEGSNSEVSILNMPDNHEDYSDSCFHDPSSVTFYSKEDLMSSDALYGEYSRPSGNISRDDNPLNFYINSN